MSLLKHPEALVDEREKEESHLQVQARGGAWWGRDVVGWGGMGWDGMGWDGTG